MLFDKAQRKLWKHGLPRCEHRSSRFVLVTTAAGARTVREQCDDCGHLDSTVHKIAEHPDAPPFDPRAAKLWNDARDEAGKAAQALAQQRYAMRQAAKPAEDADWWAAYDDFLHGDLWQQTRTAILRRDQGRCTAALPGCTREAQQVHHNGSAAYMYHRRLGSTPAFLLHSVCVSCHAKITEADRAERGAK